MAPDASSTRAIQTRASELFGVRYPIVQTGMGWVAYPPLVIAVSNAGGLGILAAATLTLKQMNEAIAAIQAGTSLPFGVNLRTDAPDIDQRIDALISAKVPVASFAQAPREAQVKRLKDAGIVTIPTVGARRHAEKVAEWGVDAVIAQGAEGGGHTGSVPTFLLLGQVLEAIDLPVLAAGGIVDGRGLAAALAYGADGVAMGTRFLLSSDSLVPPLVQQRYFDADIASTIVSTAIDGAPQRVIRTKLVNRLERAGLLGAPRAVGNAMKFRKLTETSMVDLLREGLAMKRRQKLPWRQVIMAANAPLLTKAALLDGHPEVGILPTGMGLGVIDSALSCEEIINQMVATASQRQQASEAAFVGDGAASAASATPTSS